MHEHFLQSNTWANFKKYWATLLKAYYRDMVISCNREKDRFGTYVYAPYGPYAVDETALGKATRHLLAASKGQVHTWCT